MSERNHQKIPDNAELEKQIHTSACCVDRILRPYFFLILGLRIFFQNIKVGGGKKIKIKNH